MGVLVKYPGSAGNGDPGLGISAINQVDAVTLQVVYTDSSITYFELPQGTSGVGIAAINQIDAFTIQVIYTDENSVQLTLPQGPQGDQGGAGNDGSPGVGISSINQIDAFTIEVNLSNETTQSFTLPPGPQGAGPAGEYLTISKATYLSMRANSQLIVGSDYIVTAGYYNAFLDQNWDIKVKPNSPNSIELDCYVRKTSHISGPTETFWRAETSDIYLSAVILKEHDWYHALTVEQMESYPGLSGVQPFMIWGEVYFKEIISGQTVVYKSRVNNENTSILKENVECLLFHPLYDLAPSILGKWDSDTHTFIPYTRATV